MDDTKEDDRRLVAGRRYGRVQDDDRGSRGKHHSHWWPELKPEADPQGGKSARLSARLRRLASSLRGRRRRRTARQKSLTTTTSHPPPTLIRCRDIGSANRVVPGPLTHPPSLCTYVHGRNAGQERRADGACTLFMIMNRSYSYQA